MKVKEIVFKLDKESYIGINSLDHNDVFALGNKRSIKLQPYFDRDVINISVKQTKLINENDEDVEVPYLELLIKHKEYISVSEAVDIVINKNFGDLKDSKEERKSSIKYKTLLDIKEFNFSIDKLLNLRCECIDLMRLDWSSQNFERLSAYSEVLLELDAISFH